MNNYYDSKANAVNDLKASIRILRMSCVNASLENCNKLITALTSARFDFTKIHEERFLRMRFTEVTNDKDENNNTKRIKYDTVKNTDNVNTLSTFNKIVLDEINTLSDKKDIPEETKNAITEAFNNFNINCQNISTYLAGYLYYNLESFE